MIALIRTLLPLGLGVTLGLLLAVGVIVHDGTGAAPLSESYVHDVTAALQSYQVARSEGSRLLNQRDADPLLGDTLDWRQSFGRVVQEHDRLYAQIQGLDPPLGAEAVQQCLQEGFRLTVTGEEFLTEAFRDGGHQAYYRSAHGNWDLNLGDRAVARCRTLLAAIQTQQ